MNALLNFVKTVNLYLSDYILIFLLVGTGLFFTFRTKFVQIRCFGEGVKAVFGGLFSGKKAINTNTISSFQALATAVAAQVGTGNIVGASGAILTGGPGALFWMWIIAFFGMATIYAEAVLSIETRKTSKDGTISGGPVYYIKRAFSGIFGKFLAGFFAVATILALGFMGIMVQSNSITSAMNTAFGAEPIVVGVIIAVAAGLIFLGGIRRIALVTEKLVPVMALFYIAGGIVVLLCRVRYIPETLSMIFTYAFKPQAIIGGTFGVAIKTVVSQGVKRGLFSNEAGMGSTPHAHAVAHVKTPHEQGIAAMIGVFIDTFVVLTMTGLIIVSTLYAGNGPLSPQALAAASEGINKNNMVQLSVGGIFNSLTVGNIFVAICLVFFSFSTIISWNYFGRINSNYLFGKKFAPVYTIISLIFICLGAALSADIVWELADMFNQLMVIPNVIALWALSSVVACNARKK